MLYGYGILNNHVPTLRATVMGAGDNMFNIGLYAVYKAEGNNNLSLKNAWNGNGDAVDSKSGNDGTIATPSGTTWVAGSMTYGSGKLGSGAFTFSGSNFVTLPNASLNFTTDFSVSAWIYVPTAFGTNISRIISCFDNQLGATTYRGWEVVYNNGTIKFQIYTGSANYYIISVPMTLKDQWVHVTAVRINGQQGEIYINGSAGTKTISSFGATSADAIAYNGTSNLAYIGALYDLSSSPRYSVTPAGGFKIDSVQTWNGSALSSSAVTELYNSGNGQEYPFTLSSVMIPTANDALATYNGTAQGGLTYTAGKSGNAFNFNGTNAYVSLPDNMFNSFTGDFSVSFWYKPNNITGVKDLVSSFTLDGGNYYGFQISSNNDKFVIYTYNGTLSYITLLSSANMAVIGNWVNITITRKSSFGTKMYINGALDTSNTSTTNPVFASTNKNSLGASISGVSVVNYANGLLDEVNVWNKELTSTEVTNLYNTGTGKFYPY